MAESNVLPDTTVPVVLSGSFTSVVDSGAPHDLLVGGVPFLLWPSEEDPYIRDTQEDRKEQFDNSTEAGEQSFGYWWLRSQSSFHGGQGQTYLDSGEAEIARTRFATSSFAVPWEAGELSIAGSFTAGPTSRTRLERVTWSGVEKIAMMSSTNHQVHVADLPGLTGSVTYSCGASGVCQDMTTDGSNIYVAVNNSIYRIDSSGAVTLLHNTAAFSGTVLLSYVKQRLILCIGNKVYTADANPAVPPGTPTLHYTHPSTGWNYTSIASGPNGIYLAGSAGPLSEISSSTVSESGGTVTLGAPVVQMQLPPGEICNAVFFYINSFFALATSNGVRVGQFTPYGQPQFGALLMEGMESYSLTGSGSLIYVGQKNGLAWVDLGTPTDNAGRYASAVYTDELNGSDPDDTCVDVVIYQSGGRDLVFTAMDSGNIYYQPSYTPATATLTTSWARFGTTELKRLHYIAVDGSLPDIGSDPVLSITVESSSGETLTFSVEGGDDSYEFGTSSLNPAQSYRLIFTLRDVGGGTGVALRSWQMKAQPTPRRYREKVFPLMCMDREKRNMESEWGYEGYAIERLLALEGLAETNDLITVVDRITNTSFQAIIRRCQFQQRTLPSSTNKLCGRINLVLRLV